MVSRKRFLDDVGASYGDPLISKALHGRTYRPLTPLVFYCSCTVLSHGMRNNARLCTATRAGVMNRSPRGTPHRGTTGTPARALCLSTATAIMRQPLTATATTATQKNIFCPHTHTPVEIGFLRWQGGNLQPKLLQTPHKTTATLTATQTATATPTLMKRLKSRNFFATTPEISAFLDAVNIFGWQW